MAWAQIEAKYIWNWPNILKVPKQISQRFKANITGNVKIDINIPCKFVWVLWFILSYHQVCISKWFDMALDKAFPTFLMDLDEIHSLFIVCVLVFSNMIFR